MRRRIKYLAGIVAAALLVGIDQITKYLAVIHLKDNEPIVILKGVFELTYVENRGAAFGILQNQRWIFLILTVVVCAGVCLVVWHLPQERKFLPLEVLAVFILSGAVGNLIDRVLNGYVVDFFSFCLIRFPVFNVADCYVTVSCIALLVLALFYRDEDLDRIWPFQMK